MLQLYPENAKTKLEFDKIQKLLLDKCTTDEARKRSQLSFHTEFDRVKRMLEQTKELKNTFTSGDHFPTTTIQNLEKELHILTIPNASLQIAELIAILQLCKNIQTVFSWFKGKKELFPYLFSLISEIEYEKSIQIFIHNIIDERHHLRDDASKTLIRIRKDLSDSRQTSRRAFDANRRKYDKLGYLSDIGASFLNNRRCLAVKAEYKRIVKGIFHGESDTGKTIFIEPENTISLNNEIIQLETEEHKEIKRILREVTALLAPYQPTLTKYYRCCGIYDFIRAKALLATDLNADMPHLTKGVGGFRLEKAAHPILFLKNQKEGKKTIPLNIAFNQEHRILVISGPNAGGKTVAMKTIGLLQMMLQAGLLIPVASTSEMCLFRQIMVHIGDTQSIETELSTYSAHLKDMDYFMKFANGKTLFFIDELGSGSDPYLGGTFAEAILEEMVRKHSFGVITTHYLNLKIMAGKAKGMFNGAMLFDEKKLQPLFQLAIGKPGSSYTFAIAKRSGLPEKIIDRAKKLTNEEHIRLDKLLLQVEQQAVQNTKLEQKLIVQIQKNKESRKKFEQLSNKEEHRQQMAALKLQNQIKKEELAYLRETERKFRQLIQDWKKTEDKQTVIKNAEQLLFKKKQLKQNEKAARKADKNYQTLTGIPKVGDLVRSNKNHQIGIVEGIKGKKAIVRIGKLPFTVDLEEWVIVLERKNGQQKRKN